MQSIDTQDDLLHKPDERADWRESYYFNFVDLSAGVSGFTTIGLLPNAKRREFVFILFYDDRPVVHFLEPAGALPDDLSESLSDGHLSYELIQPLNSWKVRFTRADASVDLVWRARLPPHDFGRGSGTSWNGHFEQSCQVIGDITLPNGRTVKVNGLGQRDKSWGSRDWHITSWFALHAQFDEYSIGLRRDVVGEVVKSSGGITSKSKDVSIVQVDVDTVFTESPSRMPVRAVSTIRGDDGSVYTLESSLISSKTIFRFERQFPGGTTELFEGMAIHKCRETGETATGLLEWLFTHVSK